MDTDRRELVELALVEATEHMCGEGQGFTTGDLYEVAAEVVERHRPDAWWLDMLQAQTGSRMAAAAWAETHGTS